ncbi:MAG: Spy/CpxP family protein refolding chaperone [Pseudomonadota bacterium]
MHVSLKVAVATSLCVATAVALAAPRSMWHRAPEGLLDRLAEELQLDAVQRLSVADVLDTARGATAQDREALRDLRRELGSLPEDFDAGEAQRMADEIGAITTRLVYVGASSRAAVYELLTTEQQRTLDGLKAERQARRETLRQRFGGAAPPF